jgi:predicted DCC family thiol-disulfide oxidoreductase YuxK
MASTTADCAAFPTTYAREVARALLYDADCGFCTSSVQWAVRLGCQVEAIPWQAWPHLAEFGITREAATAALHLVDGNRILIGHEAVAGTLRRSSHFAVRIAGRALGSKPLRPLGRRAYAWVAANRHRLPGSTAACQV